MVAVVVPQLVVAAVVEFAVVVVAVAAVEYLAVVATYQDVGVTVVDVVAHQLDVAAVVVDVVQVEGVATGVAAAGQAEASHAGQSRARQGGFLGDLYNVWASLDIPTQSPACCVRSQSSQPSC